MESIHWLSEIVRACSFVFGTWLGRGAGLGRPVGLIWLGAGGSRCPSPHSAFRKDGLPGVTSRNRMLQ